MPERARGPAAAGSQLGREQELSLRVWPAAWPEHATKANRARLALFNQSCIIVHGLQCAPSDHTCMTIAVAVVN